MSRPPVVTDIDRQRAIDQKPATWDADVLARWQAIPEAQRPEAPLAWENHVAEQVERFEAQLAYDRKPAAEWSGLWRRWWWPKADPAVLHPREAPHVPHPYAKAGDPVWPAVLAVLTPSERQIAERFGVAQFKPSDPRASVIGGAAYG